MADMHGPGRIGGDVFDIDLVTGADLRAAEGPAVGDHRGEQPLPVADGETNIDETRSGDGDRVNIGIFLQLDTDNVGERARIVADGLGEHHCRIGGDIAMAGVARRLYTDTTEVEFRSLFLDDINLFKSVLNSVFEVCEKVHRIFHA